MIKGMMNNVRDFVSDHLAKEIIMNGNCFGVVYFLLFEKKKYPKNWDHQIV
jgi:hypothetical protein